MSKVLLVSPPFYRLMGSHYNGLSLGLGYIASLLKQNGHEVVIYNADFYDSPFYLDQKQLYENYDNYKKVLNDLNDPIWEEIRKTIKDIKPDFIGIQMYTGTFKSAQIVATIARDLISDIKIIVGGTHPSLDPIGTINLNIYDYVVRGEGEFAMLEIVNGIDPAQIKGVTYKNSAGEICNNEDRDFIEDLDSLPFPGRDCLYNGNGKTDIGAVITSRGCPFRCAYCASPRIWKRKTQFRSVDNVLEELIYLVRKKGVTLIRFQDDTFTLKIDRTMALCEKMLSKDLNIKWICDTRVDRLNKDILQLMKRAGCVRIKVGVESGSNKILESVDKGISVEKIRSIVRLIKEVGISLTAYFMIGFPGETDEDVRKTIRFAEEIEADYNSLSVIAPYYGTKLYSDLEKSDFKFDKCHWEYFYHQSKEMILNTQISPSVIEEFFSLNDIGKGKRI
jgi:radical SAM superfamily enzyme YgiQ (UPF0313 family)